MPLANKPLNEITEADLQELIYNQVAEGKEYDYKLQLPNNSDGDKKEFLADVSSFANTGGGHLIIGMDEEERLPTKIVGLSHDPDIAINRIENMLRDGIAPRIQGIDIRERPVNGGNVFIIRVPRSWSAPHMVTFAGSSKFYARNSGGKYQLDVNELRSAFTLSETATERIRNFRLDRIAKIAADETPLKLNPNPKLVFHLVPMGDYVSTISLSALSMDKKHDWQSKLSVPIVITDHRFNLDGLLFYGVSINGTSRSQNYVQIFRNGTIEFVDMWVLNSHSERYGKVIMGSLVEKTLIDLLPVFFSLQRQLGIQPPVIIMLTLLGIDGYEMVREPLPWNDNRIKADRSDLLIPDVLIENFDNAPSRSLKPLLDTVWNSFGWPHSMNYDENENWNPPP